MIYWHLFLAFLIPGILGYGGGPASIPLVQYEVVNRYGWMTSKEFSEVLAAANTLPGPIATKMAGYVGYQKAGVLGSGISIFATVAPSLILMIVLLKILLRYKESLIVSRITNYIRPIISVLLLGITWTFFKESFISLQTILFPLLMMVVSYYMIEVKKNNPAFVILIALSLGAILGFFGIEL